MMQALVLRYVQYFYRRYHRLGTLWESRFRSCLVQKKMRLTATLPLY
ncbi:MAG: putative transposase [Paraglaciecola sp.]|jgi:putative transposase